jgi:hypothetical protein
MTMNIYQVYHQCWLKPDFVPLSANAESMFDTYCTGIQYTIQWEGEQNVFMLAFDSCNNFYGKVCVWYCFAKDLFRDSIVASIPACHAGDRGSIPRRGAARFASPLSYTVTCFTELPPALSPTGTSKVSLVPYLCRYRIIVRLQLNASSA